MAASSDAGKAVNMSPTTITIPGGGEADYATLRRLPPPGNFRCPDPVKESAFRVFSSKNVLPMSPDKCVTYVPDRSGT